MTAISPARRAAIAAAALVLPLSLAACSGSSDAEDPTTATTSETTEATDTATTAEEGAEATTESTTEGSADAEPGAGDDAAEEFLSRMEAGMATMTTAHMVMDMSTADISITSQAQLDYTTDPVSMQMTMEMPTGTTEVVSVDGTYYTNLGEMTGGMWLEMSPEDMGGVDPSTQSDPLSQMKNFRNSLLGVEKLGQEDVEGVSAERYRVTVDTTALDQQGSELLPPSLDYQIWLDSEGRMVQMVAEQEVEGQLMTVTTTMSKFGEPVTIQAPAADQIMDMSQMQG